MFPDTAISGEDPQVVSLFVGVCLYGSFARGDVHEFICHTIRFSLEFSIAPKRSAWHCHAQIIILITRPRPRQHSSDHPSAMIFRAVSTSFGTKSTGTLSSPTVFRIMYLAHADWFLPQYFFFIIFAIAGISAIPSLKNAQVSVYSHCTISVTSHLSIIPR